MKASMRWAAIVAASLLAGCRAPERAPAPPPSQVAAPEVPRRVVPGPPVTDKPELANDPVAAEPSSTVAQAVEPSSPVESGEIVICGRHVRIAAPVVLWTEAPFYDATRDTPRFADPDAAAAGERELRYVPGRVHAVPNPAFLSPPPEGEPDTRTTLQEKPKLTESLVPADSHDGDLLATVVDQFVLHYDACGLARTCFRVLQDERKLSVHFLLDLDGTIYQTMDVRDTAWHATKSNPRSVGIEIANLGAYAARETWRLDDWYRRDERGTYVAVPARVKESGIRTPGFVARPARGPERIIGTVQGRELEQYDFTPEQYHSLVELSAALCHALPRIAPDAPRDEDGQVLQRALADDEWREFQGILGHHHVQTNKTDPGPAFDWERFLAAVKDRLEEIEGRGG